MIGCLHPVTKAARFKSFRNLFRNVIGPAIVGETRAHGSLKQYVRDHLCLRTEPATNDVTAYGVKKAVENLPQLHDRLSAVCDNYLNVQQDILESFVDRGQLHKLTQPTVLPQ